MDWPELSNHVVQLGRFVGRGSRPLRYPQLFQS